MLNLCVGIASLGRIRWCNAGADPGFLARGFKCRKGGSFSLFHTKTLDIHHENVIIWVQRGVSSEPLEPSLNSPLQRVSSIWRASNMQI